MRKREAKRIACRYLAIEAGKWICSDWAADKEVSDEDNDKIEAGMRELERELLRRAGE